MSHLFDPLPLRSLTLRNRIGVSPMCMYSSEDGHASEFHVVHAGSRAVGGAALVFTEATAVEARGRISPHDMGLWKDSQIEPLARVVRAVKAGGAVPALQLAHAGRKASTGRPWGPRAGLALDADSGGWQVVGPSALPFSDTYPQPRALTIAEIAAIQEEFVAAARRALEAGYELIELHAAHGYLAHSFYSPLSNHRDDAYGGSFEGRIRFTLETATRLRAVWPERLPLAVRLSCSDWTEGGWTLEDSIALARRLKSIDIDLIDCSSGGNIRADIPLGPGYQVPFAEAIRREAQVACAAVGLITEAAQAGQIISSGQADLVLLAREMLRDPYFPFHAARALGEKAAVRLPVQYGRAE